MAEFSVSTRKKVANLIRLLASNQEGERLGSVHALDRTLKTASFDFHALADQVQRADAKPFEAEMRTIYDAGREAGYAAGVRAVVAKLQHDEDGFRDVDGTPSWRGMARYCQDRSVRLRDNKADFVDDMVGWTVWREPTEKQARWLNRIYARLGEKP